MRRNYVVRSLAAIFLIAAAVAPEARAEEGLEFVPAPVKADAPAGVRDFFRRADEDRRVQWRYAMRALEAADKALGELRAAQGVDPKEQREKLAGLGVVRDGILRDTKELARQFQGPARFVNPLEEGQVGTLDKPITVVEVLSGKSAVVRVVAYDSRRPGGGKLQYQPVPQTVVLRYDTKDWTPGKPVEVLGPLSIIGTTKYDVRTLLELEPIDLKPFLQP